VNEGSSVLLTCAGRRGSLLKLFQAAAHGRGSSLLAADFSPLAPTLYLADKGFGLPRVLSADYIPHLLALVQQERVNLIVPTIDTELLVLSRNIELFAANACVALVSSPRLIEVTTDKWLTALACGKAGIRVPRSWLPCEVDSHQLPERLFLKPRDGSASQHIYAASRERLAETLLLVPNAIIQEHLEGFEITIDALLDLQGHPIHYVPRRRIRTLGGESIEGVTIEDVELRPWILTVLEFVSRLGGRGPITLQAFLTQDGPVLTEINARFGGGFPLTHAAGGHYPEWILRNLHGEALRPCFGEYKAGLYMTRYSVEHFTEALLWS
jgi:carbamoyl-phosphate synthase large subunit